MLYHILTRTPPHYIFSSGTCHYYSEAEIKRWWQSLKPFEKLSTMDGEHVFLLEEGQENIYDGPDYKNVKILIGSKILFGDVEFHLKENDWFTHNHHQNLRYANVILHVVGSLGKHRAESIYKRKILTALYPTRSTFEEYKQPACQLSKKASGDAVRKKLQSLMMIRWIEKVQKFYQLLLTDRNNQNICYVESFRTLGFKGNENLYYRLAISLPLEFFQELGSIKNIEAVLYGAASLIPPDCQDDGLQKKYQELWDSIVLHFNINPIIEQYEWRTRSIRPAAHPEIRLRFGADLIRVLLDGWQPWRHDTLLSHDILKNLFAESLPGKGWCSEWLGNVLLPLQEATAIVSGRSQEEETSRFNPWCQLKLGYTYGKLLRQFKPYLDTTILSSFSIQQGLIELQHRYCRHRLCGFCPLIK